MIEITNTEVFGWRGALRGIRNPYDSWDKSDSFFAKHAEELVEIGMNDMDLCQRLIKAGTDHRKFLRMIHVQVDIKAPLYWWKEADTYKIGTTANSCSTMHTIAKKEFTYNDFSNEIEDSFRDSLITHLNTLRSAYLKSKDKDIWRQLIQDLPCSYMQLRTWDLDYETLIRIYFARKCHKLSEWHKLCDWIETLPYMKDFLEAINEN